MGKHQYFQGLKSNVYNLVQICQGVGYAVIWRVQVQNHTYAALFNHSWGYCHHQSPNHLSIPFKVDSPHVLTFLLLSFHSKTNYDLDVSRLQKFFRELQSKLHPDRFSQKSEVSNFTNIITINKLFVFTLNWSSLPLNLTKAFACGYSHLNEHSLL